MRFALLSLKVAIVALLQHFTFQVCKETQVRNLHYIWKLVHEPGYPGCWQQLLCTFGDWVPPLSTKGGQRWVMGPGRRAWVTRAPFTALVSPGPLRGCNEQAQGKSSMRKNSKNLEEAGLYFHRSSATPRNRCFFFFQCEFSEIQLQAGWEFDQICALKEN